MRYRKGVQPVKSYEVHDGVISLAATCLLAKRQASYRRQELYSGSIMELGNLHGDDGLLIKQSEKKADSQREMHNRFPLESKYRSIMQGRIAPMYVPARTATSGFRKIKKLIEINFN